MRLTNHWRLSPHWAMELGMVAHNRIAIRPDFYQSIGYPDKYKSVAPAIGIEWRPKAEKGIVLKLDYEQGFKTCWAATSTTEEPSLMPRRFSILPAGNRTRCVSEQVSIPEEEHTGTS